MNGRGFHCGNPHFESLVDLECKKTVFLFKTVDVRERWQFVDCSQNECRATQVGRRYGLSSTEVFSGRPQDSMTEKRRTGLRSGGFDILFGKMGIELPNPKKGARSFIHRSLSRKSQGSVKEQRGAVEGEEVFVCFLKNKYRATKSEDGAVFHPDRASSGGPRVL